MIYDPNNLMLGSKTIDRLVELAQADVTTVLGENWWRYKRLDKKLELRALISNLVSCVYVSDGFDEVAISRDKNQYRRGEKNLGAGRGYGITVPLTDALIKTHWCVYRGGFFDPTEILQNYRSRIMPTTKIFQGNSVHDVLQIHDNLPEWEVRDCKKMPIIDYRFTTTEIEQIEELRRFNRFMQDFHIEIPPLRLVMEFMTGRVRCAKNLKDRYATSSFVNLDDVLACGNSTVEAFANRSFIREPRVSAERDEPLLGSIGSEAIWIQEPDWLSKVVGLPVPDGLPIPGGLPGPVGLPVLDGPHVQDGLPGLVGLPVMDGPPGLVGLPVPGGLPGPSGRQHVPGDLHVPGGLHVPDGLHVRSRGRCAEFMLPVGGA